MRRDRLPSSTATSRATDDFIAATKQKNKYMVTTFANIAAQLEKASAILIRVNVGTSTPQLALFSADEGCDNRFKLITSDGFDGHECWHVFHAEHNEKVPLFNYFTQALMRDIDGNAVQISIYSADQFKSYDTDPTTI